MDEYENRNSNEDLNENRKRNDNNISIPKPLFALLIVVLCGAVCYSAYNAGYMKGISKAEIKPFPPDNAVAAGQSVPAGNNDAGSFNGDQGNVPGNDQGNAPGNDQGIAPGNDPGNDLGDFFRDMQPFNYGNNGNNTPGNGHHDEEGQHDGNQGNAANDNGSGNTDGQVQRAFLDIRGYTVTDEERSSYNIPAGVMIMKVSEGGAAEKAGIKEHSVITAVDGKTISSMEELKGIIADKNPGDTVMITLYEPSDYHGFEEKTISVTLSDGEAVSKDN